MIVSLSNVLLVVIIARMEAMSILDLLLQQNLETRDQLLQLLSQTSSQASSIPCRIKFQQPCTSVAEYSPGGRFYYKTFDQCHSLCCADPSCRSFDTRSTSGYNCAISYRTRTREELELAESEGPCGDDQWSYSEI